MFKTRFRFSFLEMSGHLSERGRETKFFIIKVDVFGRGESSEKKEMDLVFQNTL